VKVSTVLLLLTALASLGACGDIAASRHAGQPTQQGQSMQSMLADVEQVRAYVYGSGTQEQAQAAAADLVSWSGRMAELFPPGQASQDYVDMSPARVSGAPTAMSQTAGQLLTAVRTGRRPMIGDQLTRTEQEGCGFCHLSGTRQP
jgi:Cytochrome C'